MQKTQTTNNTRQLKTSALVGIRRGIEKEGLRVTMDGHVAQTDHPRALGSTLTHPSITTDYSEALLEFITPVLKGAEESIDYLTDLHAYTANNIPGELIWPASMPCLLEGDESIPIARYGSSNIGIMKHVYRRGLAIRYGRIMQSIAGIHYNFSLSDEFWQDFQHHLDEPGNLQDFKSKYYFQQIRNFRRQSWILHYLFGASPVVDRSFIHTADHGLEQLTENTFGLPYATSLRMSDLGYQNSAQDALHVSYNSLDEYVTTLGEAVGLPYAAYEKMGVMNGEEFQQLNTNILQLENEYYSDIRPKRVTRSGEKPIHALLDRGVEYIEVRILDINPFVPVGIEEQQMHFLDAFLLSCLTSSCSGQTASHYAEIAANQRKMVLTGRDPALTLTTDGEEVPFKIAANEMLDCMLSSAGMLDQAHATTRYTEAVEAQRLKVADVSLTPSQKIMQHVKSGEDFVGLMIDQAESHKNYFAGLDYDGQLDARLRETAKQSLQEQYKLESADTESFADFLARYNAG